MEEKLTIENLPKRILREVKNMLRWAETEVWVISRYGMLAVVRKNYYCDESMDEKLLLIIREEELFTEDERTENYINYFHKYLTWYTGHRDEAMLEQMRNDMDFDQKTLTYKEPFGRMVDGDFVYTGEFRMVKVG